MSSSLKNVCHRASLLQVLAKMVTCIFSYMQHTLGDDFVTLEVFSIEGSKRKRNHEFERGGMGDVREGKMKGDDVIIF